VCTSPPTHKGDIGPYQNNYDRRVERAVTSFDVPQRLTITTSWDLPVGRGIGAYFNTAAFSQPADFTFGNVGARVPWLRNAGMNNINLTLTKQFVITEKLKVNLRASSFNLANHPVFGSPNTTFGALGQFGRISNQANFSRQTEIVLRVIF